MWPERADCHRGRRRSRWPQPTLSSDTHPRSPTAVVWINGRHAVVAVADDDVSGITSTTVERMIESEADFVGRIVGAVGDSERVMVLGPASLRLAVQRAYVAISHRPDRLVEVTRTGPIDAIELAERLRALGTVAAGQVTTATSSSSGVRGRPTSPPHDGHSAERPGVEGVVVQRPGEPARAAHLDSRTTPAPGWAAAERRARR